MLETVSVRFLAVFSLFGTFGKVFLTQILRQKIELSRLPGPQAYHSVSPASQLQRSPNSAFFGHIEVSVLSNLPQVADGLKSGCRWLRIG